MVQQNKRYVYTVPSSGIFWDPLSCTHEEFLASIRDYNSKDSLMDVLQETRRIKVEEVTRFSRKLISYVREFVDIGDLDILFGQDKMYKVIVMESIEEQDLGSIRKRFKFSKDSLDPDIEYYYDKSFSPTTLLRKLVQDLDKNHKIIEMSNKIDYIGNIATLINEIRVSFIEHLTGIHPRTFVEIKLI
jgi:hypothetical protein